jgi:23S rRNA (adenine2503-C2)-methyltransferase
MQVVPTDPTSYDYPAVAEIIEKPASFFGLTPEALDQLLARWQWPAYRGGQLRQWVYTKLIADPAAMSNLSKADRALLAERLTFSAATIARHNVSNDGTQKALLTWGDTYPAAGPHAAAEQRSAEAVIIPDGDRVTACVSSQVGCPVGCRFCASGMGGVKGNLSAAQIVEQIFVLNILLKSTQSRINHVVFMGMGEPLANYANVMTAVRILHDPECFNLGARKITISTVGVPAKMRELAREKLPLNLAISLHAPDEALRRQLIPWAEHFPLPEILDAARYYFDQTGREITLEYILLSGVNDRPDHARALAKLCKTLRANVNLIRYNEVETLPFTRPTSQDVTTFQTILRNGGVNAHVRKSRGRDIDAACGQLRKRAMGELPSVKPAGLALSVVQPEL